MSTHDFGRVHDQRGAYNSAEHESFRAAARCVGANIGYAKMSERWVQIRAALGVRYGSELSPQLARDCRLLFEAMLPHSGELS